MISVIVLNSKNDELSHVPNSKNDDLSNILNPEDGDLSHVLNQRMVFNSEDQEQLIRQ